MPNIVSREISIAYLQRFLTHNKARGMVAELALPSEVGLNDNNMRRKLLSGGWLLSPKVDRPQHYRYWISVLPDLYRSEDKLQDAIMSIEQDRGWQALATFLYLSGIGIIVSGAIDPTASLSPVYLHWHHFVYQHECLLAAEENKPFEAWPGTRGRAAQGTTWQADILARFQQTNPDQLTELALRQAFYYGYLKQQLKKPCDDPYDVDAFIVSYSGSVMPLEIKEKSTTSRYEFGIDAGRILMLLRLCLATDSNALYLIRQIDTNPSRQLIGWKYITLTDLLIGCRWNLQAGGAGMGGSATQTVMISGEYFQDFGPDNLAEEWLHQHHSLQGTTKLRAAELAQTLASYLPRS